MKNVMKGSNNGILSKLPSPAKKAVGIFTISAAAILESGCVPPVETPDYVNTAPTMDLEVSSPDGTLKLDDPHEWWADYTLDNLRTLRIDVSNSTDNWTINNFKIESDLRWELVNGTNLNHDIIWWTEWSVETLTLTLTDDEGLDTINTKIIVWE